MEWLPELQTRQVAASTSTVVWLITLAELDLVFLVLVVFPTFHALLGLDEKDVLSVAFRLSTQMPRFRL